jgi:hypothetical protein
MTADRTGMPPPGQPGRPWGRDTGEIPRCGTCAAPIRSCGPGEGYEHTPDPTGRPTPPPDHVAWWLTTRDLRAAPATRPVNGAPL